MHARILAACALVAGLTVETHAETPTPLAEDDLCPMDPPPPSPSPRERMTEPVLTVTIRDPPPEPWWDFPDEE